MDDNLLASNPEFQGAFQNVGDLFVFVAMLRHDATLFQKNAGEHDLVARNHLSIQERIQLLEFYIFPRRMFQHRFRLSSLFVEEISVPRLIPITDHATRLYTACYYSR